jgi:hypothetical protein
MTKGVCFTSAINASELYYSASTSAERDSVDKVLYALKVLGINSRYSLEVARFSDQVDSVRDALFCAVAFKNKLPILTENICRYSQTGLEIITSQELRN